MSVLVIGRNGRALMPTTSRKARILLKKETASVVCRHPFTIQLLYKTGCATQEGCIGIDTGSQHIGVGVTCEDRVILKEEHELRSSMEKRSLLVTRAAMRRGRRYRKVRYRKPKWRHHTKRMYFEKPNRRGQHWRKVKTTTQSPRPKGWLPPSLQSKCDHHFCIIDRYLKYLPDSITRNLVIEAGRFDMARMNDPMIHGEMYQRGPMYDAENLRAYIFARDNYQCACCKAKAGTTRKTDGTTVKLVAHHILFRSQGATDNPKYMVSVCDHCHTTKAHQPGGVLYSWMENNKKVTRGLRDATFMNILRQRLFARYPQAAFTSSKKPC
ncbi:MAG: RRXRR domain-containing protein [Anaerobutyricum soehngenii]